MRWNDMSINGWVAVTLCDVFFFLLFHVCASERVLGVIFKWIYDGKVYAWLGRFLFDFRIWKLLLFSLLSLSLSLTPFFPSSLPLTTTFHSVWRMCTMSFSFSSLVTFNLHCIGTCVRLSHFSSSYKQKAHTHTYRRREIESKTEKERWKKAES